MTQLLKSQRRVISNRERTQRRQRQGRPPGGGMRDLQTSGLLVGQRQQNMAETPQQSFEELNWFTSQTGRDTQEAVICNEKEWVFLVQCSRERGQNGTKGGWDLTSRLASSFCYKLDLYQFNTALRASVSRDTFFGVLFLKKTSSLSSSICPDLH